MRDIVDNMTNCLLAMILARNVEATLYGNPSACWTRGSRGERSECVDSRNQSSPWYLPNPP